MIPVNTVKHGKQELSNQRKINTVKHGCMPHLKQQDGTNPAKFVKVHSSSG